MYRRVMYQVSERIAQIEGASALVTESLLDRLPQTLDIVAVNESVNHTQSFDLIGPISKRHYCPRPGNWVPLI